MVRCVEYYGKTAIENPWHCHRHLAKMSTRDSKSGIVYVVFFAAGLTTLLYLSCDSTEERLSGMVERVRSGENYAFIHDPELVPMLAADSACVANLEIIYLEPSDLSDTRYARLKDLSNVREVHCAYFPLVPKSLEFIAAMPSIERISFMNSGVSEEGVLNLAKIKGLKEITFTMMTVPRKPIDSLRVERPDITVSLEECEERS